MQIKIITSSSLASFVSICHKLDTFLKKQHKLRNASTILACGQDCGTFSLLVMMRQSPDRSRKCHLRPVVLGATGKYAEEAMKSKTASHLRPLNQFLPPGSGLALPPSLPLMGDRHTSVNKVPSPNLSLNSSTNYEASIQIYEQIGDPSHSNHHVVFSTGIETLSKTSSISAKVNGLFHTCNFQIYIVYNII